VGWSRRESPPELVFDLREPLDALEMRLLRAPLYPPRRQIGTDGFLGWAALDDLLGGPHDNVGTVPILARAGVSGLIRVDGGMSLMAGTLRRSGPQGALNTHRPAALPAHLRPVLEELAQLLGLVPLGDAAVDVEGWAAFVRAAAAGFRTEAEILARVQALREAAGTRQRAAEHVGVHRNTLTRHLALLERRLGSDPWGAID
jgi:hypothetical protein